MQYGTTTAKEIEFKKVRDKCEMAEAACTNTNIFKF